MMEKLKRRMNHFLWGSLIFLALLCVCVFYWITSTMVTESKNTISEVANIYMEEISKQYQNHFDTLVNLRYQQINAIIEAFPPEEVETLDEITLKGLESMGKYRGFIYMSLYNKTGNEFLIYGDSVAIVNKEIFMDSMNNGKLMIGTGETKDGNRILLYGISVGYPNGEGYPLPDGSDCTALVVGLPIEKLNEALALNDNNSIVFSHIVRQDGSFVIKNSDTQGDNYFTWLLEKGDFGEQDAEKVIVELKKAIINRGIYTMEVSIQGDTRHIYCIPMENSQWSLITVMPHGALDNAVSDLASSRISSTTIGCGIILIAAMIIFAIYFQLSHKQIKEIEKAQHEAEHANQAKSEFLSNMSHDIRTPMNAIVGLTAIAITNIDNKEQVKNCLQKITLSSKHLLGLINDVLDMSKIESGKLSLNMELISLKETMESIVNIVQPQIKAKDQVFNISIKNIISEQVFCDGVRLNQILINLLSNAMKFTPEKGSINVSVKQEESEKGNDWVRTHFWVKDTGIGMTPEFQKRIFESFVREDNKRVHKTEGSGLGMTITKYIVDKMEGSIEVESELDKGTTFHVVLDFEKANTTEEEMMLPEWNMLVVDDDEELCQDAVHSLKEIGIHAEYTTEGKKAVEMVKKCHDKGNSYQVVLIDWKMPVMNGIETAKAIRESIGDEIPILLISANDYSEIEDEAKEAGVNGFISKPLFKSTLYHGLAHYMHYEDVKAELAEQDTDFSNVTILLAEDNDINYEIANELLSERGFKVEWAENGKQCVEMFKAKEPNYYQLILMDLRMPIMDGYQATEMIRNLADRPDGKDIPILAMTADAFVEDINHCLEVGMNDHLAKPLDVNDMLRKIQKHMKNTTKDK